MPGIGSDAVIVFLVVASICGAVALFYLSVFSKEDRKDDIDDDSKHW